MAAGDRPASRAPAALPCSRSSPRCDSALTQPRISTLPAARRESKLAMHVSMATTNGEASRHRWQNAVDRPTSRREGKSPRPNSALPSSPGSKSQPTGLFTPKAAASTCCWWRPMACSLGSRPNSVAPPSCSIRPCPGIVSAAPRVPISEASCCPCVRVPNPSNCCDRSACCYFTLHAKTINSTARR